MSAYQGFHGKNGKQRIQQPLPGFEQPSECAEETVAECTVFNNEQRQEIWIRRKEIKAVEDERKLAASVPSDQRLITDPEKIGGELVGLALSGGGIRSASFSIGLLQAFGSAGFMKYVDYLSTVSGGGYAGALFSSKASTCTDQSPDRLWKRIHPFARDIECKYDEKSCPRPPDDCSLRSSSLNQAIQNGEPATCHRKSTQPTGNRDEGQQNKLVQSLAYGGNYLFRSKAEFASRYFIGFLLNNLVLLAGVVSMCALIAWSWRWLDHPYLAEKLLPSINERYSFSWQWWDWNSDRIRPFLPVFVLMPLWLFAWSFARLGFARRIMFGAVVASILIGFAVMLGNRDVGGTNRFWDWQNSIYPWLGLAGALLPFVRPKLLMDSAVGPKSQLQSYAFLTASTILLVGGPLFGVFWFAREDFARLSEQRVDINQRDFIVPDRLLDAIDPDHAPDGDPAARWRITAAQIKTPDISGWQAQSEAMRLQGIANEVEKRFRGAIRERVLATWERTPPATADGQKTPIEVARLLSGVNNTERKQNLAWLGEAMSTLISTEGGKPAPTALATHIKESASPDDFLRAARLRADSQLEVEWQELGENDRQRNRRYYEERFLTNEQPRLRELLARYRRYGVHAPGEELAALAASEPRLKQAELAELNRLVLNAWYPAYFHTRSFISTPVVLAADQSSRLRWFLGLAGICLITAFWFNPNTTSMQGYYRDRLTDYFIAPTTASRSDIDLAHLDTCKNGAPYHLISGAATLKTFRNALGLRDPEAAHDLEIFLFSKLYCGSRTLRYAKTKEYLPKDCETLGNAVAVSGAAIGPDSVNDLLLRAVMTILNLRQGQWLPNPSESRHAILDDCHKYWEPSYLWLLLGMGRPASQQRLCFVTDGGHRENLGLVQLLLRRCKLIIASDASCDPTHRFDGLARMLRICDMHLGIRFEDITPRPSDRRTGRKSRQRSRDLQSEPLDLYGLKRTIRKRDVMPPAEPQAAEVRDRNENKLVERHYLLTRIIYPGGEEGLLVYLKPSLNGDESEVIENYRAQHADFPHESTSDQEYDPAQFASYMMLGRHIGEEVAELFSPHRALGSSAESWWQTYAVAVDRLTDHYLSRKPQGEDAPTASPPSGGAAAESGPNDHPVGPSQNGNGHPPSEGHSATLVACGLVFMDDSRDLADRESAIDQLMGSQAAQTIDPLAIAQLQAELDPSIEELARRAVAMEVGAEDVKLLEHFGAWALVTLARSLGRAPVTCEQIDLFERLVDVFADRDAPPGMLLLQELEQLKTSSETWPTELQSKMKAVLRRLDDMLARKSESPDAGADSLRTYAPADDSHRPPLA